MWDSSSTQLDKLAALRTSEDDVSHPQTIGLSLSPAITKIKKETPPNIRDRRGRQPRRVGGRFPAPTNHDPTWNRRS